MSELNNDPKVNIPENVPGRPEHLDSLTVLFMHSSGQYKAVAGTGLMLYQVEPGKIGLGQQAPDGKGFEAFVIFPGTLALEEKRIVVPEPTVGQLVTP